MNSPKFNIGQNSQRVQRTYQAEPRTTIQRKVSDFSDGDQIKTSKKSPRKYWKSPIKIAKYEPVPVRKAS